VVVFDDDPMGVERSAPDLDLSVSSFRPTASELVAIAVNHEASLNPFEGSARQVLPGDVKRVAVTLPDRVVGSAQTSGRGRLIAMEATTHDVNLLGKYDFA
jgi:hypothetical protein